jgi:hypothetical protein
MHYPNCDMFTTTEMPATLEEISNYYDGPGQQGSPAVVDAPSSSGSSYVALW